MNNVMKMDDHEKNLLFEIKINMRIQDKDEKILRNEDIIFQNLSMKFRRSIDFKFNCTRFSIEEFNDMILFMKLNAHLVKEFEKFCIDKRRFILHL
jgi:hypothetical protein